MIGIGEAIKTIRKERGIKQKDLAEMCELSTNSIVSIENGTCIPKKKNLERICLALNVPMAYLALSCLTKEDLPDKNKVVFEALIEPLKQYLIS